METKSLERQPARERLLAAANELFYEEGVHTVGIDRVIEHAGVAKATLYNAFGSKDELIHAYLTLRHAATQQRIETALAIRYTTPRAKLIGIFEVLGETFASPGFRGCAFMNASAEARPGSPIEEASDAYRGWFRSLCEGIAREGGAADPGGLAKQLALLYTGATAMARMDRDPDASNVAKTIATALIDAALPN